MIDYELADLMSLWNLTPHSVKIFENGGKNLVVELPSCGDLRLDSVQSVIGHFKTIPIVSPQKYTGLNFDLNLKIPPGVPILVSMIVGEYLVQHPDQWTGQVYAPDTSPAGAVRDKGAIVGCMRLVKYK